MQKGKIKILSTKPVGKALVEEAALHDIIIDEIAFIHTEEISGNSLTEKIEQLSHEKITAVFTSTNAVKAVKKFVSSQCLWKIFCLGNATKKLVRNAFGEKKISGTADDALRLAEIIISDKTIHKVYFFCGDQRRDELPVALKSNNIEIEELVVYKTIETPQVVLKKYDGILFFSPSAVQSFFLKNSISPGTKVFAIGSTTANAVKLFTPLPVITPDKPGKENLVNSAINHFNKTPTY